MQIRIRGQKSAATSVAVATSVATSTSTANALQANTIVAVFVDQYSDEVPQLGRVIHVANDGIELEWMSGCYSGKFLKQCIQNTNPLFSGCIGIWKTCKHRVGRESVVWTEKVPVSSVLYPVQLTKSNRLKATTVEKLKASYASLL